MTTTTPTDTVKPQQTGLEQLSKSFEPAAIEAQWGPEWEKRSYATAGYRGTSEARADADGFRGRSLRDKHRCRRYPI